MRALSPAPPQRVGVWLHKLHLEGDSTPLPFRGNAAQLTESEQSRRASLRGLLQKAVLGQELSAEAGKGSLARYPEGEALFLNETHINYIIEGNSIPIIPLLLADVVCEPVRKRVAFGRTEYATHVVLVAPRPHTELTDHPEDCSQVWLLCIGRCSDPELTHLLFNLSRRGALRWDVKQSYSITRKVCGIGGQGAVFSGTARTHTRDVQLIMKEETPLLDVRKIHRLDEVAVKVWNSSNTSALRSEISFLQMMCGHPNVSTLLGVFCELGDESMAQRTQWVTVVELCPGGDLFDLAIQQENAMQIMVGLFSALIYLHASKIAHRDVKAENVVLHGERAVLIDFGIACRVDDEVGMKKRVGSPGYVAPEIITHRPYNEKVDVFAAGVILYFMLRGKLPFSANTQEETLEKTVKCDVSYSAKPFAEVSPGIIDVMKMTINRDVHSRPSAFECFYKIYSIASPEVRSSEAFQIAKMGLVRLGDLDKKGRGESQSRASSMTLHPDRLGTSGSRTSRTSHTSRTSRTSSPHSSAMTEQPELESLGEFQRSGGRDDSVGPAPRTRSTSGSVWQLIQGIQELPSAAMRRFRQLSGSTSFTPVRQMCNVVDLPKVAIGMMTPENSVEFSSIAEDRSDTVTLPSATASAPVSSAAMPVPPPQSARQMPVWAHGRRPNPPLAPEGEGGTAPSPASHSSSPASHSAWRCGTASMSCQRSR
eukprot:symbB.v1.2.032670.t1/scaffold3952.1/size47578/2